MAPATFHVFAVPVFHSSPHSPHVSFLPHEKSYEKRARQKHEKWQKPLKFLGLYNGFVVQ